MIHGLHLGYATKVLAILLPGTARPGILHPSQSVHSDLFYPSCSIILHAINPQPLQSTFENSVP